MDIYGNLVAAVDSDVYGNAIEIATPNVDTIPVEAIQALAYCVENILGNPFGVIPGSVQVFGASGGPLLSFSSVAADVDWEYVSNSDCHSPPIDNCSGSSISDLSARLDALETD